MPTGMRSMDGRRTPNRLSSKVGWKLAMPAVGAGPMTTDGARNPNHLSFPK